MKILKIVGVIVALLIVVAIALPFMVNVNNFRPEIESNLSSALGQAGQGGQPEPEYSRGKCRGK